MILTAVARSRNGATYGTWFDGKLGIWSFVERTVAQQTIKNRLVGNLEFKPVTAVRIADNVYTLLDNIILAIAANFRIAANAALYTFKRTMRDHTSRKMTRS